MNLIKMIFLSVFLLFAQLAAAHGGGGTVITDGRGQGLQIVVMRQHGERFLMIKEKDFYLLSRLPKGNDLQVENTEFGSRHGKLYCVNSHRIALRMEDGSWLYLLPGLEN